MLRIERDLRSALINKWVLTGIVLTAAYVLVGRLGLLLAVPPGYATAVFPPAGIAAAARFIGGRVALPWIFLGSFLLNAWTGYAEYARFDTLIVAVAVVIAAASTLQAAIGGWWLRRLIGYPACLDDGRDLARFFLSSPVFCLTSATLSLAGMAALGAIDGAHVATSWLTWWIGDTLGVLLLLPLIMIAAGEPRPSWRGRALPVGVPLLLLFALFVAIFIRVSAWENEQSLIEFRILSQQVLDRLNARLGSQEIFLQQLGDAFVAPAKLSRDDFQRLARRLLERFSAIQALEWAPRVDAARRPGFEVEQRRSLLGFEILDRDDMGALHRAGERPEFYPVTYLEPLRGNELAVGFDLAGEPNRRAAVMHSLATGRVAATGPIRLVQETGEQRGMLLVSAVPGDQDEAGVVVAVLRMGAFMASVLEAAGPSIEVALVDRDDQGGPLFDTLDSGVHPALYEQDFDFAGRRYAIRTAPSQRYLEAHRSWESLAVLMAGVLGTSLLGALLLLGTGERDRFARLLAARTRERDRIWQVSEDLLGVSDFAGHFVSTNPAWTRTLGWSEAEIRATQVDALHHPDDRVAAIDGRKRLAEGVNTVRIENRLRHQDGSYRWIYWTMTAEEGLIYVIGRDVTADKESAHSLRRAEEQVRQLQKMESVGQLTGGIAHDFNNLLTAILGNLDMARAQPIDESTRGFLASALRAAERGARLVQQLLAFSRQQQLRPRAIDINALVVGMRDLLQHSIGVMVRVNERRADDLWPAMADPNQIEQVILNLAINARDAMPLGGDLLIATDNSGADDRERPADLAGGDYVCITVSDSGTGMTEEVMAKALEPFFTTKEPGKGSGLGLSMVHGVAKQLGGAVTLSSSMGRGTTVRVYLPRAMSAATARDDSRTAQTPDIEILGGKRVLVIDDDADVRQIVAALLGDLRCRVVAAENGREGLEALDRDGPIDLVLVDFAMPGTNGLDVVEAIRSRDPRLPIVMITGYSDIDLAAASRNRFHLLKKPFHRAELLAVLAAAFGCRQRALTPD